MDDARWHVEIFEETARLAAFLNSVRVTREQIVETQFQALGASQQRILLVCRLSQEQFNARERWLDVERTLNPGSIPLQTGGGH